MTVLCMRCIQGLIFLLCRGFGWRGVSFCFSYVDGTIPERVLVFGFSLSVGGEHSYLV